MNYLKVLILKNIEYNTQTSHNRSVYASPLKRLGFRSARSFRYASFPRLTPAQFATPGLCFAKPLFGLANRRIQPERYATFEQGVKNQ